MMIDIQCPNCSRTLKVPEKYVGTEGACNYCGGRVHVQLKQHGPASMPPPAPSAPPEDLTLLQTQLAEAQAEIARLSEATDSERTAREKAETERDSALARSAELDQMVAQAAERERSLSPRAELEKAKAELAESREFAGWLGHELEAQRDKTQRARTSLRDICGQLSAVVEELTTEDNEEPAHTEAALPEQAPATVDFTPADAAAILVGAGSGEKNRRWAWVVGAAIALAAAAGIGVWGLALAR